MRRLLFILAIAMPLLYACKEKKVEKLIPYNGPVIESNNIETIYTDSSRLKIRVKAAKQQEFENGARIFPKGIFMEFYDLQTGKKSSTLKGNHARYLKDQDVYIITGNVIVQSFGENKSLKTEELTWHPVAKQITSDKFVHIQTPTEILTGDGLVSNEDFTVYRILKPKATIFLD